MTGECAPGAQRARGTATGTTLGCGLTRKLACSSVHFAAGRWTRSLRSLAISLNRLVPSSHRPHPSLIGSPKQKATGTTRRARVTALLRRATTLARRSVALPTRQWSEPPRTVCGPWLFCSLRRRSRSKLASSAPLTGSFLHSLMALAGAMWRLQTGVIRTLGKSAAQFANSLVRTPSPQWQPNPRQTRC